jgi:hypothetical protein
LPDEEIIEAKVNRAVAKSAEAVRFKSREDHKIKDMSREEGDVVQPSRMGRGREYKVVTG